MDNVIRLDDRRPEPMVWQCACKCTLFYLYQCGKVECADCTRAQNTGAGTWAIPEQRQATITTLSAKPTAPRDYLTLS